MKIDPGNLRPLENVPPLEEQPQTDPPPPKFDQDTVDRMGTMQYKDLFQSYPSAAADASNSSALSFADEAEQPGDQQMQAMSTGGGGTPPAGDSSKSKSKDGLHNGHYTNTIVDLNENKQVAVGGDKTLPKDIQDLGVYKGGKTIGQFDVFVSQKQRVIQNEGDWGKAFFKAQANIVGVQGRIFYEGKASLKDMELKGGLGVEAKVELIGAYYSMGYETPSLDLAGHKVNLNAKVDVTASVQARGFGLAEVGIGKDTYLKLGGELFAGVKTTIEGSVGIGEFADAHGGFDAYAGVGAEGSITFGFKDGKIDVDADGGLAFGSGFGLDFGFDVNLVELAQTAGDLGKEGADAAGGVFDWLGGLWDSAAAGAQQTANSAGAATQNAADSAGDVVDDIVNTAEDTGQAVVDFFTSLF